MAKIAEVIRFYSLNEIMDFVGKGGEYPLHHAWCYDQFQENGFRVDCIEYNKNSRWNKMGYKLKILNLQQQINFLKRSKEFDVIYAPFIGDVILPAILKIVGLYKKPILGMAIESYIPYKRSFLKKMRQKLLRYIYLNGTDSLLFITEQTYDECNQFSPVKNGHGFSQAWGVDLEFFTSFIQRRKEPPRQDFIYATGSSGRDYKTLFEAFRKIDFSLKLTTKMDLDEELLQKLPSNIIIDNSVIPGLTSVGEIRKEYYNSLAVAIPLSNKIKHSPIGLTVFWEALAMAKPIICTYNSLHPFDIEKEKVGFSVGLGDVEGWRQCINYFVENPDEAREMGERGQQLCRKKYNYNRFSDEVLTQVKNHGIKIRS